MKAWYSMMVLSLVLMGLNGCTPTRVSDRVPPLIVPERWQNASDAQPVSTSKDLSQWWKGFGDPMLNDLIDRALATNHDLRLAKARVREAKAMVTVAESALYPSIDLFAFGGRDKRIDRVIGVPGPQGIELIMPTADVVSGGLAARWEIDVFGSRHLEAEAAVAQSAGTEETQRAVQVGLLAQVATNYLELRGIQQRTHILLENIEVQRERLRVMQTFYKAGLVNDMDVARQETLLHNTVGTLPVLTSTAKNLIHRLSVLLGETPASLEERLTHSMPLPVTLPSIPRLLPSSVLEQRPDLRLAQTEVKAAAAGLGAARAEWFA
jgi:NodT family efflux transporter outer membrane factor (OMF) lipoprotein